MLDGLLFNSNMLFLEKLSTLSNNCQTTHLVMRIATSRYMLFALKTKQEYAGKKRLQMEHFKLILTVKSMNHQLRGNVDLLLGNGESAPKQAIAFQCVKNGARKQCSKDKEEGRLLKS